MGIINLAPDSFSDGGRIVSPAAAAERAARLRQDGADWLDVGGESTRPGAAPIPEAEELARVIPAIEAVAAHCATPISVDTMKPAVARVAMAAGASMWNDVSGLRAPAALETAADLGCQVVIMHMQGEPATMQEAPRYGDVVAEVSEFLVERARAAEAAGVDRDNIWVDPGFGFGKTLAHNLAILRSLHTFAGLGYRLCVGASRKGMIRALDPSATDPTDRLGGSLAIALAAARAGAQMIRVHDVRETVQALKVDWAIHG
ncbi:MAG: dihydropteroate synthase [Caulobacteraceae bacterium]